VIVGNTGSVKTLRNFSDLTIATYSGTFALNETGAGNFKAEVTGTQELRLTGIISGAGGIEKTGAGSGALRLTAANTYSGPTTVSFGTLTLGANASIANSSIISVASGATFDVSAVAGGFSLGSAQTLGGSGTVTGAVSLTSTGSILSPGASPGILSFDTNQAWNAFSYEWEVNDWTGTTAGTAFDQIAITGSLDLSSGTAYQLDLLSLDAGNASGQVPNFAETARSWTILTTTTGITGFSDSLWTIGTSGFSSSPTATGTFSLATGNGGQDLVLTYVPVPEPAAVGLLGVAGLCAGLGLARLRRRAGFPFGQ
jgi:autotransporter-associated beta strand protein